MIPVVQTCHVRAYQTTIGFSYVSFFEKAFHLKFTSFFFFFFFFFFHHSGGLNLPDNTVLVYQVLTAPFKLSPVHVSGYLRHMVYGIRNLESVERLWSRLDLLHFCHPFSIDFYILLNNIRSQTMILPFKIHLN